MKPRPKTKIEERKPPFENGKPIYLAKVWERSLQIWFTVGVGSTPERAKKQLDDYLNNLLD